ncbi:ABC transporter substrate binding protein [Orrella sp. JC864]|uniref:ABC transporter substrate-binding protein n=1 Tax=Orrella sp. JC864 TaxID=3120298 RepID=UPI00300AEBEE
MNCRFIPWLAARVPGLALACTLLAVPAAQAQALPAATAQADGAAAPRVFPVAPVRKPDGSPWQLGYLQGGDYTDYPVILAAIVRGLHTLGWIPDPSLPDPKTHTSRQIWDHLVRNVKSDFVRFVPDGYYTAGNFDASLRGPTREALSQRLAERRDIDLMIAMGTWAGQDMAAPAMTPVPTIVASTSDPIASRIVASAEDSGRDHIHAKVEPDRYQGQVRLFHDIVPFKTLGVVYEDSAEGRTFGGVDAVEQMARALGFQVRACHAPFNNVTPEQARQSAQDCYARIAPQVDAVYITVHRGVTGQSLPAIVDSLVQARVPSFSMLGSDEVRQGVLMSMAQADYLPVGLFHAETIARIFHGASPRELSQIWISPAEIALNLKTAELIGFDPPIDILLSSDEVYDGQGRDIAD